MSSAPPNAIATNEDFEFAALSEARNYREALIKEFSPVLKGNVMEIGAGIGQITNHLLSLPRIVNLLSIEPDPTFADRFRNEHPAASFIEGTIENASPSTGWDSILSINVLEHIEHDEAELCRYRNVLLEKKGALCLFVPARPEIYAPIDDDFGHYRRYTRAELMQKLKSAGFSIERLSYFNCLGYFAWWFNFCVLKKRNFERGKVVMFDRLLFPIIHNLESRIMRPPFGQSLLAIARAASR